LLEISPLVSYSGENLMQEKIKIKEYKNLKLPIILEIKQ